MAESKQGFVIKIFKHYIILTCQFVLFQINQYPWLVRIGEAESGRERGHCGGTIIASRYIISAAHCFFSRDSQTGLVSKVLRAADIKLWIGDHDLETTGETRLPEIQIRRDSEI